MIQRISLLNRWQRIIIFTLMVGGAAALVCGGTVFVVLLLVNSSPREIAEARLNGISVMEFAQLPGDDAYPASIASDSNGFIYSASYDTGAVWRINPQGDVGEIDDTREMIGSATGLAVGADDTLYILDRLDNNPNAAGGVIWRIVPGRDLEEFSVIADNQEGFISANDITVDNDGIVYVSDRGHRAVWRFSAEGGGEIWWSVPQDDARIDEAIPTGLAYDSATDTLLVTDSEANTVYRVSLDGDSTEILYRYDDADDLPGFDGISAAPDGTIYIAALGTREVLRLDGDKLTTLAGNFRGSSDVEFRNGRLYVANWDQRSLAVPGLKPQLPFALDVLDFGVETE
jgi:sugar lactone lactonase YvrE